MGARPRASKIPLENCADRQAPSSRGRRNVVHVACTGGRGGGPAVALFHLDARGVAPPAPIAVRAGVQEVGLDGAPKLERAELELSGGDALKSDDRAPIAAESDALGVRVGGRYPAMLPPETGGATGSSNKP